MRFQLNIRTVFIIVLFFLLSFAFVGHKAQQARQQRSIVSDIRKAGGVVEYDYQTNGTMPAWRQWLHSRMGVDFLADVSSVLFAATNVDGRIVDLDKATVGRFSELPELVVLDLSHTLIDDSSLTHLCNIQSIEEFSPPTGTSDRDLAKISGMKHLRSLTLINPEISEACVNIFNEMQNLRILTLINHKLKPATISKIERKLPNAEVTEVLVMTPEELGLDIRETLEKLQRKKDE